MSIDKEYCLSYNKSEILNEFERDNNSDLTIGFLHYTVRVNLVRFYVVSLLMYLMDQFLEESGSIKLCDFLVPMINYFETYLNIR